MDRYWGSHSNLFHLGIVAWSSAIAAEHSSKYNSSVGRCMVYVVNWCSGHSAANTFRLNDNNECMYSLCQKFHGCTMHMASTWCTHASYASVEGCCVSQAGPKTYSGLKITISRLCLHKLKCMQSQCMYDIMHDECKQLIKTYSPESIKQTATMITLQLGSCYQKHINYYIIIAI